MLHRVVVKVLKPVLVADIVLIDKPVLVAVLSVDVVVYSLDEALLLIVKIPNANKVAIAAINNKKSRSKNAPTSIINLRPI